jgi:hypothetical protein
MPTKCGCQVFFDSQEPTNTLKIANLEYESVFRDGAFMLTVLAPANTLKNEE